ncbi:MAG: MBL fold metallo-hydrolase [Pseudomonadota bacterium]
MADAPASPQPFTVTFWGVRGTVATPGPQTVRYGGNTACIEVNCGTERLIFDLGTGARRLGKALAVGRCEAHLFLTHTHLDHIVGFPFFKPLYDPQNRFQLWAGHLHSQHLDLHAVLSTLMKQPLFPIPLGLMHSKPSFQNFRAGEVLTPAPEVVVRTALLNHPGGSTGYRVEFDGRTFALVTDVEHQPGTLDPTVLELIQDADVVVYDCTYTDACFPDYVGWGHSTWQQGVRLADQAGVGQLVAFHHDPDSDDTKLDAISRDLEAARPGSLVAAEGLVLTL